MPWTNGLPSGLSGSSIQCHYCDEKDYIIAKCLQCVLVVQQESSDSLVETQILDLTEYSSDEDDLDN